MPASENVQPAVSWLQRPLRRIVVKLGTNLITGRRDADWTRRGIDEESLSNLVSQIAALHATGMQLIVVTSGAVGAGREVLSRSNGKTPPLPRTVAYKQMLAALGQTKLMTAYERLFGEHNIQVAQALISRGDLTQRQRYLNVRDTLEAILEVGAIPVVNENDVVAVDELAGVVYGDNDRLSAMVANDLEADLLILLGELDGLYQRDPHRDPAAEIIREVPHISREIRRIAKGPHDGRGSGGMASKLEAADLATSSGTPMIIASGRTPDVLRRIIDGEQIGTRFPAAISQMEAKKRWLMTGITDGHGAIHVDSGAVAALEQRGRSLLAAGITMVEGNFDRGDIIKIEDADGQLIACGLTSYSSDDLNKIKGRKSGDVQSLLGHFYGMEVVHRNNMALV
ncbi:MAG: glutamate 5-kinase [Chloroflexi bacterium]|nr:glutamate 5-kinase [Chloroflexota bacterium]